MADIKMVFKMSIWFDPKMLKNTIKICCSIEYDQQKYAIIACHLYINNTITQPSDHVSLE